MKMLKLFSSRHGLQVLQVPAGVNQVFCRMFNSSRSSCSQFLLAGRVNVTGSLPLAVKAASNPDAHWRATAASASLNGIQVVRHLHRGSSRSIMDSGTSIRVIAPSLGDSDPIKSYLSVLRALDNLDNLPILGDLVNGATEDGELDSDSESELEGSDQENEHLDADLRRWGHDLGRLLAEAAHYTAFACGGSTNAVTSKHEGTPNGNVKSTTRHFLKVLRAGEVVLSWPLDAPAPVAELLACCTPAHFGDLLTQTTVLEPSVRTAMEIPAVAASHDGYYFEITALSSGVQTIYRYGHRNPELEPFQDVPVAPPLVRSLTESIFQRLTRDTTAVVPYKLNVYGPGGFFKPHVDTPSLSAARMIGTAVVVLPCAFSGGALRVCAGAGHLPVSAPGKPPARELLFDWGVDSDSAPEMTASTLPTDTTLPWAAFYGDCVHEVLPVTAGHRITLTFGIVDDLDAGVYECDSDNGDSQYDSDTGVSDSGSDSELEAVYESNSSVGPATVNGDDSEVSRSDSEIEAVDESSSSVGPATVNGDDSEVSRSDSEIEAVDESSSSVGPATVSGDDSEVLAPVPVEPTTSTSVTSALPDRTTQTAATGAPPLVGTASIITRILAAVAARPAAAAAFGILLSHKYTLGAVSIAKLKGADSTLYAALKASGSYSLRLQPVAYHYHRQGPCPGDSEGGSSSHTVHAFGAPELEAIRKSAAADASDSESESAEAADCESTEVADCESTEVADCESTEAADSGAMPFVRFFSSDDFVLPGATPGSLLKRESIEEAEYTGNSATAGEDDYIYFSVALLVAPQSAAAGPSM